MKLLLKNGRVVDPENGCDEVLDVLIEKGKIIALKKHLSTEGAKVLDVQGKVVVPGLIDMHVHLREPGREDEETILTGARAAARGGFTAVACMPNTEPPIDNQSIVKFIYEQAEKAGLISVFPVGSITKGLKGEALAEIGELYEAGVVAISDDGKCVENSELMRRALEYAKMFNLTVISHAEDKHLRGKGVMNEGYTSTLLGLPGIPAASEEIIVARDLKLAELSAGRLHLAHISSARSVEMIREAKTRGVKVTAETAPHYFCLTEEAVKSFDSNTKMNPPLRTASDVIAIKQGLKDGTIDVIASDHAPHTINEKEVEFSLAPFGVVGLETTLPLTLTKLVGEKVLTLQEAILKLSTNPARILGLKKGTLAVGADADITVIDLDKKLTVKKEDFFSRSKNSPFLGWELQGTAALAISGGRVVVEDGKIK